MIALKPAAGLPAKRAKACSTAADIPAFVRALERVSDEAGFRKVIEHWGVRRTHPQFWHYFHDLSAHIREREPREAGVLDMNRYENL